jgi:hypothetical protein
LQLEVVLVWLPHAKKHRSQSKGGQMADVWQTIEQAAVTLGLSVRTVNRHITAGKLQSRLFEGRREVFVSDTAFGLDDGGNPYVTSNPTGTSGQANFASSSGGARDRRVNRPNRRQSDDTVDGADYSEADLGAGPADGGEGWVSESNGQVGPRQRVTPEVASERPLDLRTMLALTDSIDDKATLAVAAYQTLARSAETQVQSLRKVAYGAWAVVGLMAAGITVAVGWAAIRLTSAETSATYLKEQLDKANAQAALYQNTRDELAEAKAEASHRNRVEEVNRTLLENTQRLQEAWERIAGTPRQAVPIGSTGIVPLGSERQLAPVGSPATSPSAPPRPPPLGGGSAGSRPSTNPAQRPGMYQNAGSPTAPNPSSAFGPK